MFELWEHNAASFSKEQLEWFSGATDYAGMLASDLQDVIEGLGCLISEDGARSEDKTNRSLCAENFQSHHDIPMLLFFIARSLDNIQGLIEVGDSAKDRLAFPERYRKVESL